MIVPACREKIGDLWSRNRFRDAAHAGLVLAVCLQKQDSPEHRTSLLRQAGLAVRQSKTVYDAAFRRWKKSLAKSDPGLKHKVVYAHGRMVIGLGTDSVLETGLTLHHTYGTPIIPGSALKGLAAHYCDQVWGAADVRFKAPKENKKTNNKEDGEEQEKLGECYRVIFGTQEAAGYIIFHDAWIVPESLNDCLCPDIMTPHHPEYYGGDNVPASDFDDPNPISFLSVKGAFHVALSCDIPGEEGGKWSGLVLKLLTQALEHWGIGAKTFSGYGRMGEEPPPTPRAVAAPRLDPGHTNRSGGSTKRPSTTGGIARGDRIKVKRIEDAKGKGRLFFETKDGKRCMVQDKNDPAKNVPIGQETELWVMNAGSGLYTLSSNKPKKKGSSGKKARK